MFAIIETGGKQYRVEEGFHFQVEKLDAVEGAEVTLDKVLFVDKNGEVQVGKPYLPGASVTCEVLAQGRGKKVIIFKKWRRNDSFKKQGHRQSYTLLKVKAISA